MKKILCLRLGSRKLGESENFLEVKKRKEFQYGTNWWKFAAKIFDLSENWNLEKSKISENSADFMVSVMIHVVWLNINFLELAIFRDLNFPRNFSNCAIFSIDDSRLKKCVKKLKKIHWWIHKNEK